MTKNQLITLTASYQLKLSAMAEDFEKYKQNMTTGNGNSSTEHSKYKSLARRLKEERNSYKTSLEEKQ